MIARAIAFALAALTVLAAPAASQSVAPAVLRVGLVANDDAATPLLYAQRAGLFQRAGIDVRIERESSGAAVTAGVVSGSFDIGKSSVVPLVNAHAHGLPIAIVAPASVWDGKSEFAALLVRADAPLRTGKDLDGKLIAVQSLNDMNEIVTNAWVAEHGGDPSTLRYLEIPMSSAAQALLERRVDAAAFVEPQLAAALATGGLRALPGAFSAIGSRYLFAAWFSTKSWVDEHPALAQEFGRIIAQAARYTNAHHAQTAAMVAQFTAIPLPVVEHMTRTPAGTALDAAQLQPVIDAAVRYKVLPAGFSAGELIR